MLAAVPVVVTRLSVAATGSSLTALIVTATLPLAPSDDGFSIEYPKASAPA